MPASAAYLHNSTFIFYISSCRFHSAPGMLQSNIIKRNFIAFALCVIAVW